MHLEPVLIPLPVKQVNHLNVRRQGNAKSTQADHLSRAGQAFIHPKPDIEAFEEVGVDNGCQPVLSPDLLVRVEAEVDRALQRGLCQGGQCREVLNRSPTLSIYCLCDAFLLVPIHHVSLIHTTESETHMDRTSEAQKHGHTKLFEPLL